MINRLYDEEEYDCSSQQKGYRGTQEVPVIEWYVVDDERMLRQVDFALDRPNERAKEVFYERVHETRKSSTDDDGNCQIDNVAAENELLKFFEHAA
jgi:hypothetical protein